MKRLYRMAGFCLLAGALGSCNRYLDTMPDTRTELNRADKIERLLVSAYPTLLPMGFTENRTDNVEDNGRLFEDNHIGNHEAFFWEPPAGRLGTMRRTSGVPATAWSVLPTKL